jgi:hypothetical protein
MATNDFAVIHHRVEPLVSKKPERPTGRTIRQWSRPGKDNNI